MFLPFMAAGGERGQRGKSSTQLASSQTSAGKQREREGERCTSFSVCVRVCVFQTGEEGEHACGYEEENRKDGNVCKGEREREKISAPWTTQREEAQRGMTEREG